jgi:hypothetical protein
VSDLFLRVDVKPPSVLGFYSDYGVVVQELNDAQRRKTPSRVVFVNGAESLLDFSPKVMTRNVFESESDLAEAAMTMDSRQRRYALLALKWRAEVSKPKIPHWAVYSLSPASSPLTRRDIRWTPRAPMDVWNLPEICSDAQIGSVQR